MATSNKKKLYYNKVVKKYQEGKSYAVISKELSLGVKTHLLFLENVYLCIGSTKIGFKDKQSTQSSNKKKKTTKIRIKKKRDNFI